MRTTPRRATTLVAALLLGLAAALGLTAPAQAYNHHGGSSLPGSPVSDTEGQGGSSGQAGHCYVVANSSYMGLSCPGSGLDQAATIKQILGDQPVPDCWDDPMTQQDLDALNLVNLTASPTDPGGVWYWHRCLKGIDKQTKKPTGPVTILGGPLYIQNGQPHVELTPRQKRLVAFETRFSTIPAPVAGVSPTGYPRVGAPVSFFDGRTPAGDVTVEPLDGVVLSAHETSIDVEPLGKGEGDAYSCPGMGHQAAAGEKPVAGGSCWYAYKKSSAGKNGNVYRVRITSHWQVSVHSADYNNDDFADFTLAGA